MKTRNGNLAEPDPQPEQLFHLLPDLRADGSHLAPVWRMDRAGHQGRHIGRLKVSDRKGPRPFGDILEPNYGGDIYLRQAARELGIGYATMKRLLDAKAGRSP